MERMCQRQLLPAAWVALDGGADNIPALQGGATSHLGQSVLGARKECAAGLGFFQYITDFAGHSEVSSGSKDFVRQRTQKQSHAFYYGATVRAHSFCRDVLLTELPSTCH